MNWHSILTVNLEFPFRLMWCNALTAFDSWQGERLFFSLKRQDLVQGTTSLAFVGQRCGVKLTVPYMAENEWSFNPKFPPPHP